MEAVNEARPRPQSPTASPGCGHFSPLCSLYVYDPQAMSGWGTPGQQHRAGIPEPKASPLFHHHVPVTRLLAAKCHQLLLQRVPLTSQRKTMAQKPEPVARVPKPSVGCGGARSRGSSSWFLLMGLLGSPPLSSHHRPAQGCLSRVDLSLSLSRQAAAHPQLALRPPSSPALPCLLPGQLFLGPCKESLGTQCHEGWADPHGSI